MNTITYLKNSSTAKKFFGIALIILAFLVFFNSLFFFLVFLVFGFNIVAIDGCEINLDSKTFRNIKSIFGLKFGKWQPCPEFEYVSVFKTKENQTINVASATTTFSNDVILVNAFYNRNKHLTFYKTDKKEEAFEIANRIKKIFDIEIFDATEK
ncbi:MAG: hypothetical protein KBC56_06165 [Flavobacterium sp.]|nr:hypothetical protein [Flavobacterium sp.]